jgi:hypothetical protein
MSDPPVFFLVPDVHVSALPRTIEEYWHWQSTEAGLSDLWGRYHWTVQTYLYLKEAGVSARVVNEMPDRGIVFVHRDHFSADLRPNQYLYLVCLLVDRTEPAPWAQLHVLHNPVAGLRLGLRSVYMPPWPQINLIPRDSSARASAFATVGYFGELGNLAFREDIPSFEGELSSMKLKLVIPRREAWHDFSKIDCVLGVRSFGRTNSYVNKPSLKLFNAWLAGVPAVLGYESAYRCEGRPGENYLEATSAAETIASLRRLKNDPVLRGKIVAAGVAAVKDYSASLTVCRWRKLIEDRLRLSYLRWVGSAALRGTARIRSRVGEGLGWRMNLLVAKREDAKPT